MSVDTNIDAHKNLGFVIKTTRSGGQPGYLNVSNAWLQG